MEKIKRDDLAVKIICICLSLILWFYVSYEENPNMTKTVHNVPLAITGEQALKENGFSVYSISEKSVDVSVTAKRLSFRRISNKTLSAALNVSSIKESGEYVIPATVTSPGISGSASFYVKSNDIKVVIEPISEKTYAIDANIAESGDSSLIIRNSTLSSTVITVSAPESILGEIASVTTQQIIPDDKSTTRHDDVSVIVLGQDGLPIEGVECNPAHVDISYSFYDVKSVPITLKTKGHKSIEAKLSQKEVKIYGYGDTFDKITSISTETINLERYSPGAKTKVKLSLPDGIKLTTKSSEIDVTFVSAAPPQEAEKTDSE